MLMLVGVRGFPHHTHMVVYSPVARMITLNGGVISLTKRVDVKEPVRGGGGGCKKLIC